MLGLDNRLLWPSVSLSIKLEVLKLCFVEFRGVEVSPGLSEVTRVTGLSGGRLQPEHLCFCVLHIGFYKD